jgi:hypothetical protein
MLRGAMPMNGASPQQLSSEDRVPPDDSDEILFTVVGEAATLATPVRIEDLGLTEPAHLERWVIQHPETLGEGVLIIASQYDQWVTPAGTENKDRLDVLALDADGRLIVGELKRGRAPDTVDLQAIKYAAMTSRFTLETLGELHSRFLQRLTNEKLTGAEAEEKLQAHVLTEFESGTDLFRSPRIVLLAESFSDTTVTSVVWLSEQGVDLSLRRYKAYRTAGGETIVSVSQTYPLPEVGNWLLGPGKGPAKLTKPSKQLDEIAWSRDDFATLLDLAFPVPIAAMTLCAERPLEWVSSTEIYEEAGVEPLSGRGQLAGFGYSVRTRFGRSNPPWDTRWKAGGENLAYYRLAADEALTWQEVLLLAEARTHDTDTRGDFIE